MYSYTFEVNNNLIPTKEKIHLITLFFYDLLRIKKKKFISLAILKHTGYLTST